MYRTIHNSQLIEAILTKMRDRKIQQFHLGVRPFNRLSDEIYASLTDKVEDGFNDFYEEADKLFDICRNDYKVEFNYSDELLESVKRYNIIHCEIPKELFNIVDKYIE